MEACARRWDLTDAAVAVLRNSRRAPTGAHSRGSTRRQAVRACGLAALAGCAAITRSCVRVLSAGTCSSTALAAAGASCVLLNCPRPSVVCVSVAKSGMAGNGLGALVEAVVPESVHDTLQSISSSFTALDIVRQRVTANFCDALQVPYRSLRRLPQAALTSVLGWGRWGVEGAKPSWMGEVWEAHRPDANADVACFAYARALAAASWDTFRLGFPNFTGLVPPSCVTGHAMMYPFRYFIDILRTSTTVETPDAFAACDDG